jgi:outer membrane autotransporter protein
MADTAALQSYSSNLSRAGSIREHQQCGIAPLDQPDFTLPSHAAHLRVPFELRIKSSRRARTGLTDEEIWSHNFYGYAVGASISARVHTDCKNNEGDESVIERGKWLAVGVPYVRLRTAVALVGLSLLGSLAHAQQAALPIANPGPARTVADTDGLPGENIQLDGTASQSSVPGQINLISFVWTNTQGQQIANGPTASVRLPDGINEITLTVTEPGGVEEPPVSASASVAITIGATAAPVANAGAARSVADTDGKAGEVVTLDGSASSDPDGSIVLYEWFRDTNTPLGSSSTPLLTEVSLPDGVNQITLIVHDNVGNVGSSTITLTIGAAELPPVQASLQTLNLNPNERELARKLDDLCPRLAALASSEASLSDEQQDLLDRCNGIFGESDTAAQITALQQLGAEELNAMRTQSLLFSRTQSEGVMDRLLALRSGEKGVSVAGLNLRIGDQYVSAQQIASGLKRLLGGGASADETGADLLSNRLGVWLRGNYGFGEKSASAIDGGFDSDQWGFTGGVDYRVSEATVAGLSLGYGEADLDFKPLGDGDMKTSALSGSLYGSAYLGDFYVDAVINYADADYDTNRHIVYAESGVTIDRNALGSTAGDALSGGLSVGYDVVMGAFTLSPTLGYFFIDTNIDPFTERGASGLDLAYDEQNYESSTGNAGVRVTYAWKTSWGVVIPHFRGTFVREFEDATEVFGVRFAADPFTSSADPNPPIFVRSSEPDQSYFRLAAGLSAQFPYDISGYFEYQRLEGFQNVQFEDLTIGLRIQHTFH